MIAEECRHSTMPGHDSLIPPKKLRNLCASASLATNPGKGRHIVLLHSLIQIDYHEVDPCCSLVLYFESRSINSSWNLMAWKRRVYIANGFDSWSRLLAYFILP